jgi:hypothetical protein
MKKYIIIDSEGFISVNELDLVDLDNCLDSIRDGVMTVIDPRSLKVLDINGIWSNL